MGEWYEGFSWFQQPDVQAEELLVYSSAMGHECARDFLIDRQYFNDNLVMVVLKGCLHVVQGSNRVIRAGQGILMELTSPHRYYFEKNCPSEILWFHFQGRPLQPILERLRANEQLPVVFDTGSLMEEIQKLFFTAKSQQEGYEYTLSGTLYGMVLTVLKKPLAETLGTGVFSSFRAQAQRYIDQNLGRRVTLEELAEHFHLNKYYVCRKFKRAFGATPRAYMMQRRIEVAKNRLDCTSQSVAEIAQQLAFYDQGHFSKVFHAFTGYAPLAYKNRYHTKKR